MMDSEDRTRDLPPDTALKKEGVTSTFSAATGEPGRYGGEDTGTVQGSTGTDRNKVATGPAEETTAGEAAGK